MFLIKYSKRDSHAESRLASSKTGKRDNYWKDHTREWNRRQLYKRFSSVMTRRKGALVVIGKSNFRYVLQLFALHITSSFYGHLRKWHILRIPLSDLLVIFWKIRFLLEIVSPLRAVNPVFVESIFSGKTHNYSEFNYWWFVNKYINICLMRESYKKIYIEENRLGILKKGRSSQRVYLRKVHLTIWRWKFFQTTRNLMRISITSSTILLRDGISAEKSLHGAGLSWNKCQSLFSPYSDSMSILLLGTRHLPMFLLVINYTRGAILLVVARVINVHRLGN